MKWHAHPSGKRGRSHIFSAGAIQFCLSIKCLFNLPLRQAMGMTQSLLRLARLGWTWLAGAGQQHGQPTAEDPAGDHRRRADHDRLASAGGQHGHQAAGQTRHGTRLRPPGR